jgi:hypothetical protein
VAHPIIQKSASLLDHSELPRSPSKSPQLTLVDDLLISLVFQAPDEITELLVSRRETFEDLVGAVWRSEARGRSEKDFLADFVSIVRHARAFVRA